MKHTFTLILALLLVTTLAQAQVTVGSDKAPLSGSLLMLDDGTTTTENTAVNARKGLGLPRVELTNLKPTTPAELSESIGGSGNWDLDQHVGLMVYNSKEGKYNIVTCQYEGAPTGLYVWEGEKWQELKVPTVGENEPVISDDVYKVTDVRDGEVYLARNFGIEAGDWMLENMRYDPLLHPDPNFPDFHHTAAVIPPYTTKHFAYPEYNENPYDPGKHPSAEWELKKKNGLLYNWLAATNGQNTSDQDQGQGSPTEQTGVIRGICPVNWHVPSDREWNDLEREIYKNAHLYSTYEQPEVADWNAAYPWLTQWETEKAWRPSTSSHGVAMKYLCPPLGSDVSTGGKSLSAEDGGFSILLVGNAGLNNPIHNVVASYGNLGYFWSSSSYSDEHAMARFTYNGNSNVGRFHYLNFYLYSIRCKKD